MKLEASVTDEALTELAFQMNFLVAEQGTEAVKRAIRKVALVKDSTKKTVVTIKLSVVLDGGEYVLYAAAGVRQTDSEALDPKQKVVSVSQRVLPFARGDVELVKGPVGQSEPASAGPGPGPAPASAPPAAPPVPPPEKARPEKPVSDEEVAAACEVLKSTKRASLSALQRRMKIGIIRAAAVMDELEERGIVGPPKVNGDTRDIMAGAVVA